MPAPQSQRHPRERRGGAYGVASFLNTRSSRGGTPNEYPPHTSERRRIGKAIAALEAQRDTLGSEVVDAALSPLRQRLASLGALRRGARRQVTVLFGDVCGFTAMSETMDAEDVNTVMNAVWRKLDRVVLEHGGRIDKHIGDAIMCIWGWESSRENDAERAVRAALAMQAEIGAFGPDAAVHGGTAAPLCMRVGINCGLALLGAVGTVGESSAIGDAVNTASRLEGAAPVGGILVSRSVHEQIRGIFEVQAREPIRLKGKGRPVPVWLVIKAKPRLSWSTVRETGGFAPPFIGREADVEALREALREVAARHECRVVTVSGEAGIGKSRLLYEFRAWARRQESAPLVLLGRASQDREGMPYGLLRDLIAWRMEIRDSDTVPEVREKLERGTRDAFGSEAAMKSHFIGQLLGYEFSDSPYLAGLALDAGQVATRALAYVGELIESIAAGRTLLVLLEDVHWADSQSHAALARFVRKLAHAAVLWILTARPGIWEARPPWAGLQAHRRLDLAPLAPPDSRRLMSGMLPGLPELPGELHRKIQAMSEGNPYYIEEIVRMLLDEGIIVPGAGGLAIDAARLAALPVPETLTGVMQVRLDDLRSPERRALERAAVIGRIFWDDSVEFLRSGSRGGALPAAVRTVLGDLEGEDMVFPRPGSTFAGTGEYIFKHSVLRSVAYDMILKGERRRYHGRAAEWLIRRSGDRSGEYAEIIARHLHEAVRPRQEARFLKLAGDRASAQFANERAIELYGSALSLCPPDERSLRIDLLLARESVLEIQGSRREQAADLAMLQTLAQEEADEALLAEVVLRQANLAELTGDYRRAIVDAQTAIGLAQRIGRDDLAVNGHLRRGRAHWRQGEYTEAGRALDLALELARRARLPAVEADALRTLGSVRFMQGDHDEAARSFEESLALYRVTGDRRGESWALSNIGIIAHGRGDYLLAKDSYQRSLALFREIGDRRGEARQLNNLGDAWCDLGRYAEARPSYEEGLAICLEIGDPQSATWSHAQLSLLQRDLGHPAEALEHARAGLAIALRIGVRHEQALCLTSIAHASADLGALEEAEAAYREALALRGELGETAALQEDRAGVARIALERGDVPAALAAVEPVLEYLREGTLEGANEPMLVRAICFRVLEAGGDSRAEPFLQQALCQLEQQAARIHDPELRRSFLGGAGANREIAAARIRRAAAATPPARRPRSR